MSLRECAALPLWLGAMGIVMMTGLICEFAGDVVIRLEMWAKQ